MTQETSPDFANPLKTLIAPYVPRSETQREQIRGLLGDAIGRAGKESKDRDWYSLSPEAQVAALAGKLLPVERVSQAALLLRDNQDPVKPWGEEHRRSFLGTVVGLEIARITRLTTGILPPTDVHQRIELAEKADQKVSEYTSLLGKLMARATPNGPARK